MKFRIEKRPLTKLEKGILVCCYIIMVVGVLFILNLFKVDILKAVYKDYEPVALNLTMEQKLEDFDYYYDTIMSSFPMIEEYEKILGIDFKNKRGYYRELVEKTENDHEFFCVMNAISNEFPSFHTDIVFPRFSQYESLGCYNMSATLFNNKVYPASVCWDQMLEQEYNNEELRGVMYIGYQYVDGDYILCNRVEDITADSRLLEVNGMDIHEYVSMNQFASEEKQYDKQNGKIYVQEFHTNSKLGEPVTLTLQDSEGTISYYETFCELADSAALNLHGVYGEQETNPTVQNEMVYHYIDEVRDIGYINITAFSMFFAEDIENCIKEMNDCETIILDLRDNYGGVAMLPQKYIYPHLFCTDVSMKNEWYMLDSSANRRVIKEDVLGLLFKFHFKKRGDYFYSNRSYDYMGEAPEERNVIALISQNTGSAADGFAAALKKTDAILIGQNTAGEGLADSFMCDYMPNSGLVFIYMFGKALNEDGTDNSLFGTAPDIYSYITSEGYRKCSEIANAGEDPYTYENRLKWDNVLNTALDVKESK